LLASPTPGRAGVSLGLVRHDGAVNIGVSRGGGLSIDAAIGAELKLRRVGVAGSLMSTLLDLTIFRAVSIVDAPSEECRHEAEPECCETSGWAGGPEMLNPGVGGLGELRAAGVEGKMKIDGIVCIDGSLLELGVLSRNLGKLSLDDLSDRGPSSRPRVEELVIMSLGLFIPAEELASSGSRRVTRSDSSPKRDLRSLWRW